MLVIDIPKTEIWDSSLQEFITLPECSLSLEHSLISVSLWESKWHKPFLSKKEKTEDEIFDYIRCMTVNSVDENVYLCLSQEMVNQINKYIEDSMTATTINDKRSPSREIVTAEIIYYWMVALQIPFECQKWHLNRLLTLIDVCSIKNQPPTKMSQKAILARNASLNAARRRALHSKG